MDGAFCCCCCNKQHEKRVYLNMYIDVAGQFVFFRITAYFQKNHLNSRNSLHGKIICTSGGIQMGRSRFRKSTKYGTQPALCCTHVRQLNYASRPHTTHMSAASFAFYAFCMRPKKNADINWNIRMRQTVFIRGNFLLRPSVPYHSTTHLYNTYAMLYGISLGGQKTNSRKGQKRGIRCGKDRQWDIFNDIIMHSSGEENRGDHII